LRGDDAGATRNLATARALGDALRVRTGESLLHDAVATIDGASPALRTALARGHASYLHARIAYAKRRLDDAERDLGAASRELQGSPMAHVARYYHASVHFDRDDAATARNELESVARDAPPSYVALHAQLLWELALCDMHDDDWTPAAAKLAAAESLFARLGEQANLAAVRSILATAIMSAGRPDDAWAARTRAFESLSREGQTERLVVTLGGAASMEQRAGRRAAARALLDVEVQNARALGSDVHLADALGRSAIAAEESGEHAVALVTADEALRTASRISDRSLRNRAVADAQVASGAVHVNDDPAHSIDALTRALQVYRTATLTSFVPAACLYRARAALRAGRRDDARRDLDAGIAALEVRPVNIGGGVRAAPVVDGDDALFEEAIRLSLAGNDAKRAFEYAERAHERIGTLRTSPLTLEDLQRRLRGTSIAVLHLTTLPDEVIAFAIASDRATVSRSRVARDAIAQMPLDALFDLLIRPSAAIIDGAGELIVVADRSLERVPFAGLYDAQRKCSLIERVAVSVASSAAALDGDHAPGPRVVIAVELPSGEHESTPALPNAGGEVASIASLYPQATVLAARDASYRAFHDAALRRGGAVIHIAGHTELQRGSEEAALRFAGGERAAWSKIAASRFDRDTIVVLAACDTLRGPASRYVRSLSLGAAFAAAGAGCVIGTLAPIADADARELFLAIHRNLAAGMLPAQAVRRAQLDAIAGGRLPSWRSIEILTRCIGAAHSEGGKT